MDTTVVASIWQVLVLNAPSLVGIIMPPFIEVLNHFFATNNTEKKIVTMVACLGVAVFLHWNEIVAWQWVDFVINYGLIIAWSQSVFALYFNGSKGFFLTQEWINNVLGLLSKVELKLPSRAVKPQ